MRFDNTNTKAKAMRKHEMCKRLATENENFNNMVECKSFVPKRN